MSVLKIKDSKTGEWINVPYISGGLSPELKDYATKSDVKELQEALNNKQDIGDYVLKNEIPTKTSQLTNDSSFATESFVIQEIGKIPSVDLSEYVTNTELENYIDTSVVELENVLKDILEIIQSEGFTPTTIEEIEQVIVSYFENKTVKEIEG